MISRCAARPVSSSSRPDAAVGVGDRHRGGSRAGPGSPASRARREPPRTRGSRGRAPVRSGTRPRVGSATGPRRAPGGAGRERAGAVRRRWIPDARGSTREPRRSLRPRPGRRPPADRELPPRRRPGVRRRGSACPPRRRGSPRFLTVFFPNTEHEHRAPGHVSSARTAASSSSAIDTTFSLSEPSTRIRRSGSVPEYRRKTRPR